MHERDHTLYTTSQHVFSLKDVCVLVDTCTCEGILILSLSGNTRERSNLRTVSEGRRRHLCYMEVGTQVIYEQVQMQNEYFVSRYRLSHLLGSLTKGSVF